METSDLQQPSYDLQELYVLYVEDSFADLLLYYVMSWIVYYIRMLGLAKCWHRKK